MTALPVCVYVCVLPREVAGRLVPPVLQRTHRVTMEKQKASAMR